MRLAETINTALPLKVADFSTLTEGLDYAAQGETGYNFFSSRGHLTCGLGYAALRSAAVETAQRLIAAGFPRGSRIALSAETTPDFLTFFYACQYASLVPVPLPLSFNVGGHRAHVERLRRMLSAARPHAALGSDDVIDYLREAAQGLEDLRVKTFESIRGLPAADCAIRPFAADGPCYIQYSSGSTTSPRGVMVTQRAITANARAIGRFGLELRSGDRAMSWLPLYHDMGLVGFAITPMLSQITVDYLATSSFALRPRLWLKLISDNRATISFSPTFGYALCVRRSEKDGRGFDLSSWRAAGVGGEMVRPEVLTQFAELFAASGFDARAFAPSYGLAEATLAVSFTPPGRGMSVDVIDRAAYERSGRAIPVSDGASADQESVRAFASCGRPLPAYEVSICDEAGRPLPDRAIGRVIVSGPSLMEGYFDDPVNTAEVMLPDGRLDTGDMGYRVDGDLVVTGRRKDMIVCHGRNIWPQDLEWAVEKLSTVRSGGVAAFGVDDDDGDQKIVVVIECYTSDVTQREALAQEAAASIYRTAGLRCEIVLVPPKSLPYTSSGKLSRARAKVEYRGVSLAAPAPSANSAAPIAADGRVSA